MTDDRKKIIEKIFAAREDNGLWKVLPSSHKYFPDYLHYIPTYRASLWTLILLADLQCDRNDERVKKPLLEVKNHLFDEGHGIYSLKEDHFPIPCLNGNMLYVDAYFNREPDEKSKRLLEFFSEHQRFDDGAYEAPISPFCSNTSCYGKHTCYWGVVKLLKGISFLSERYRNENAMSLRQKCIDFILKHKVCYSSRNPSKVMIQKIDFLTFPNFYKGDFLEILWILKREGVTGKELRPALELVKSKQRKDGVWELERKMNNMVASVGQVNRPNPFVAERANEVLSFFEYCY